MLGFRGITVLGVFLRILGIYLVTGYKKAVLDVKEAGRKSCKIEDVICANWR